MSNQQPKRVLSRLGSRELTKQEMESVNGAIIRPKCTWDPVTCTMDGQCSPPPSC